MGYAQFASGSYHSISSASLDLSELDENWANPSNIFVECKGKRHLKINATIIALVNL